MTEKEILIAESSFAAGWDAALESARPALKAMCEHHPLIWPTDEGSMLQLDAVIALLKAKP